MAMPTEQGFRDEASVDFILTFTFAILPEGLEEFYRHLYELNENLEIKYEVACHGFKITCPAHDEVRIVGLVKSILDQIVEKETKKGLDTSEKLVDISDLQKDESHPAHNAIVPSKYLFPRDVASCAVHGTWVVPVGYFTEGITTNEVLTKLTRSEIQKLTGTVLVSSCNKRTIYIGASQIEDLNAAKKKLRVLARFLYLKPRGLNPILAIFLHQEKSPSAIGEYRYLADGNSKLLQSYVLDDMHWPLPKQTYHQIFHRGVVIRINPKNEPWKETQPISATILPIVKEGSAATVFAAFTRENWRYPARVPALSSAQQQWRTSAAPSELNLSARLPIRPKVEHRVPVLPNSTPGSAHSKWPPRGNHSIGIEAANTAAGHSLMATPTIPLTSNANGPVTSTWGKFRTEVLPRISHTGEKVPQSFRPVGNEMAGNIFPEFDAKMVPYMNDTLKFLMTPLRMWPGVIDLRIDLGRLSFLQVKKSRIQEKGKDDEEKYSNINAIQHYLSQKHTSKDHLIFTQVLTSVGADANYMATMRNGQGNPMWRRAASGRSTTYEFTCRLKDPQGPNDFDFVVEIDAVNFSITVRQCEPDENCIAVHCTQRVWDFQLVLSSSQEVDGVCLRFAKDLVHSLKVMPTDDGIPDLEVYHDNNYDVDIIRVRTKNTAHCTCGINARSSSGVEWEDTQRLYLSEVWELDRLSKTRGEQRTQLCFSRYKTQKESGMPPMWYEASLRSDMFTAAFAQNATMELGEEAEWTPEALLDSGIVEQLTRKAADMVKKMDGVGYWNDNLQDKMLFSGITKPEAQKGEYVPKFW